MIRCNFLILQECSKRKPCQQIRSLSYLRLVIKTEICIQGGLQKLKGRIGLRERVKFTKLQSNLQLCKGTQSADEVRTPKVSRK